MNQWKISLIALAAMVAVQAASWPNEPAGSLVLTDFPFDVASAGGWNHTYRGAAIVSDPTTIGVTQSPTNVMKYTFTPATGVGGDNEYFGLSPVDEIYVGFWWKPSNPFQGYSNLHNKVLFVWNADKSLIYMSMGGPQWGPFTLNLNVAYPTVNNCHVGSNVTPCEAGTVNVYPNVSGGGVLLGVWHRVEFYVKRSTTPTSKDGTFKWWLDGVLVGNYPNANTPSGKINQVQFAPAWDGSGVLAQRTNPDWHMFDHARVSIPVAALKPLQITTTKLPFGVSGKPYVTALKVEGGLSPYKWALESGTLPSGLTFYPATGFLSGTTLEAGSRTITVSVTDLKPQADKVAKTFTLTMTGIGSAVLSQGKEMDRQMVSGLASQNLDQLPQSANITVYDLQGKQVWKRTSGKGLLLAQTLREGIYLARIAEGKKTSSIKFCVAR